MNLLVSKAKNKDANAFISLIEENKTSMYKVAISILSNDADAADAMQDAILKCWRDIDKLKHDKYFKTWLTRILINCCKDIIRKNSRAVYVESYEGIEPCDNTQFSESSIKECFDGLSDNYRLILTLYYSQGFSVKEISKMLNMNQNTVKSRLSRGREQFKKLYVSEEGVSF